MPQRRFNISFAVFVASMAVLGTIAILVGWNIIFTRFYVMATKTQQADIGVGYWIILSIGCLLLLGVVTAIVMLTVSTIRRTLLVRQQTAFIDSVTHEFRTPLASVLLSLETLETRELSREQQARFLEGMKREARRLENLIEHVLEAARIEGEAAPIELHWVDLAEICASAKRRACERHQIDASCISIDLDPDLKPSKGGLLSDEVVLGTVVLNLFDNAIKYAKGTPDVALTARIRNDTVEIAVKDHGIGIDPKQLKRVFRRFYRVKRSGPRHVAGSGLGLYLVAALVKRLDGTVRATSDGIDQGSTFYIYLPRRKRAS